MNATSGSSSGFEEHCLLQVVPLDGELLWKMQFDGLQITFC